MLRHYITINRGERLRYKYVVWDGFLKGEKGEARYQNLEHGKETMEKDSWIWAMPKQAKLMEEHIRHRHACMHLLLILELKWTSLAVTRLDELYRLTWTWIGPLIELWKSDELESILATICGRPDPGLDCSYTAGDDRNFLMSLVQGRRCSRNWEFCADTSEGGREPNGMGRGRVYGWHIAQCTGPKVVHADVERSFMVVVLRIGGRTLHSLTIEHVVSASH